MSSFIRLSRFKKVVTTAVAATSVGSLYLFRGELEPHIRKLFNSDTNIQQNKMTAIENRPTFIDNLPKHIPYLLVGGGTASHSAMRAIRGHDAKAKVLIIGSENHNPYMRPALSKDLWFSDPDMRRNLNFKWWNGKERSIFYEIDEFFLPPDVLDKRETGGVSMIKNMRLTKLDPDNRVAYLENGQTITYDKCLLAPGGKPKTLPELESASDKIKDRVVYFRTADDFLKLEKIAETAKSIVIIGGGFLGSELACALGSRCNNEKGTTNFKVYQIYPEEGNLGKILPRYLSAWVSEKIANEGVQLVPAVEVKSVSEARDGSIDILLSNDECITADYIVCAIGIEPDVELARSSGLEIDETTGGYLVNSELEARSNVWVAGDASCFYDIKLGRRRVEHHDHAINSGKLAGQNMIGAAKAYTHQSMFWSDLGSDISFEAVGIIDSSLPTVAVFVDPSESTRSNEPERKDGKESQEDASKVGNINDLNARDKSTDSRLGSSIEEPANGDKFSRGLVFYLKDDIIVGILLWNLFGRLTIARRLLDEHKKYDDLNEVAKLFNVYLDN